MGVGATTDGSNRNRRQHSKAKQPERAAGLVDATHWTIPLTRNSTDGRAHSAPVNNRLRMKDSFNPNQTTPKFRQIDRPRGHPGLAPSARPGMTEGKSQFLGLPRQERHAAHRDQAFALDPLPALCELE